MRVVLVALIAIVLIVPMPTPAHAVGCSLQFRSVDYPTAVEPGQGFQVRSQMNVTCSKSKSFIVGRLDVVESAPGIVLSSSSFALGYFALSEGETKNATTVNNLVAPPIPVNWTVQVRATLFTSVLSVGGSEFPSFTIMVGHAPPIEQWQTREISVNGGFEDGWNGWDIGKNYGFIAITGEMAHSGSSSLRLDMPGRHLGRPEGSGIVGVSQIVYVANLRSVRVRLWLLDGCFVPEFTSCSGGRGRLRVQVGPFTQTYGFEACSTWCLIDQNVTADMIPKLTLTQIASILHSPAPVQVTVSLELLLSINYFAAYVDDVQVNASTPLGSAPFSSQSLHEGNMGDGIILDSGARTSVAGSNWVLTSSTPTAKERMARYVI